MYVIVQVFNKMQAICKYINNTNNNSSSSNNNNNNNIQKV